MAFTDDQTQSDDTELQEMWFRAINKYCEDNHRNPRDFQNVRSIGELQNEQNDLVRGFAKFRHSGKPVDKLRHFVNQSSGIILSVGQQISAAASASFPPAAAIMTAFTWLMKGANDTSADYEMIESFFDIMHSFLERISLLEGKLSVIPKYPNFLTRVFCSVLGLCSITSTYQRKGRFLTWSKALFKGTDEKLKGSIDSLTTDIQRLESATLFATLGQTIDSQKGMVQIGAIASETRGMVAEGLVKQDQMLEGQQETNILIRHATTIGQEGLAKQQQALETTNTIRRMLQLQFRGNSGKQTEAVTVGKQSSKDAGTGPNTAMLQISSVLSTAARPGIRNAELKQTFVKGTLEWFVENEIYQKLSNGLEWLLWITGERGLGKSMIAQYALADLQERLQIQECRAMVACFYLQEEQEESRSITDFLRSVVNQLAQADVKFREEIAVDVKQLFDQLAADSGKLLWEKIIAAKFSSDSERRLIMIVDAIEAMPPKDRTMLVELLQDIKKRDLSISVIVTARQDMDDKLKSSGASTLPVTMNVMGRDLRLIIKARIGSFSKLRRLRAPAKKRLITKITQKADSVLYVEHILRRLESIGREAPILKELDNLPENLNAVYDTLLVEARKGRTDKDLESIRLLLSWLAVSQRPITLGEASKLVSAMDPDATFDIEEEIDGALSRILRLPRTINDEDDSTDEDDGDASEDSSSEDLSIEDDGFSSISVDFQERALRQYYRNLTKHEEGSKTSTFNTHLVVFRAIVKLLTNDNNNPEDVAMTSLKAYAADHWVQHFSDIQVNDLSNEEIKQGIESLSTIVRNQARALERIEENATRIGLFGSTAEVQNQTFWTIKHWAGRALTLPPGTLSPDTIEWARMISDDPSKLIEGIARQHVYNWFNFADSPMEAQRSYAFAAYALNLMNPKEEFTVHESTPSAEQILQVADVFPDLPKTGRTHTALGLTLKGYGHYEEGLEQCKTAFNNSGEFPTPLQLGVLSSVLEALIHLAKTGSDEEKKAKYAQEAHDRIGEVHTLLDQLPPLKENPGVITAQIWAIWHLTNINLLEGDVGSAIEKYERVVSESGLCNFDVANNITLKLYERKDWDTLLEFIENMDVGDIAGWLSGYYNDDVIQSATFQTDNEELLVELYNMVIKNPNVAQAQRDRLQYSLATYFQRVAHNLESAEHSLRRLLEPGTRKIPVGESLVLIARADLADVLMEQFLASTSGAEKGKIIHKMKRVASTSYVVDVDFEPAISNTAATYALMLRQIGPHVEFESVLNKSFDTCIKALTDTDGWNDSQAIRFFSKVLAILPGLERDAQIAAACQFYYLNPDFKPKASDESESSAEGTSQRHEEAAPSPSSDPDARHAPGDIDPEVGVSCDGCSKSLAYPGLELARTCVTCTNIDLCIDCYSKRMAWNQLESSNEPRKPEDWKTFCGNGHHYTQWAPKGWEGVVDGAIIIDDEKTPFTDWLDQVKTRWQEAWVKFWKAI